MKPQKQEKKWPALLMAGGACAAVLLALIFRALNAIFTSSPAVAGPAAVAAAAGASPAAVQARADVQPNPAAISVFSGHQVELPGPRPVARSGQALQQNRASAGAVFNTDAQKIRERELGRRATIENMRRSALESGDTNAAAQQEKKLKKIEESGSSFM
ncbi:MAG: hypothetical protein WC299_02820 [Kiritimatiellia bacterium]